ncbi:nucleoside-diphosphate kinase, partial [Patescibacteria group bacterium]|nr:nucleoside-diphosphate kinase [Patescibacteria group bacterium]
MMEKSLIILKPDCLQRNLLGEIIKRFENKGLKIAGLKMGRISDEQIDEHYSHHKDKPFFGGLKGFMQAAPVIFVALEGFDAIDAVRVIVGPTVGRKADAGSIRGDFSMSHSNNIVHASDSADAAEAEIKRFFKEDEIYDYEKDDWKWVYADDEK